MVSLNDIIWSISEYQKYTRPGGGGVMYVEAGNRKLTLHDLNKFVQNVRQSSTAATVIAGLVEFMLHVYLYEMESTLTVLTSPRAQGTRVGMFMVLWVCSNLMRFIVC